MTCTEPSSEEYDAKASGQPTSINVQTYRSKISRKPEDLVFETNFIYVTLTSNDTANILIDA